jgi:hypothetical protein
MSITGPARPVALKGLQSLAQGFNPGLIVLRTRPESGDRETKRYWRTNSTERHAYSGALVRRFVLVLVLVLESGHAE